MQPSHMLFKINSKSREFLKEHRKVEILGTKVAKQHKDFEAALVDLNAQLEMTKRAPQTVVNNH